MPRTREQLAERAAQELQDGFYVNLGIGIPTLVAMVLVLATRWRGEALRGAFWLIPWLTVIATGTKGSTSPA